MINAQHLRMGVIRPALLLIGLYSEAAENLVLGTWAVESHLGSALHQIGGGPARGPGQMEPVTHTDHWASFLRYQPDLAEKVARLAPLVCWTKDPIVRIDVDALIASLWYSAAMTRVHYRRVSQPLPAAGDWEGMERYHKQHYNTPAGKTQPGEFRAACKECRVWT